MDPPIVTDIILATLALHNMPCSSPDKSVYYPLGLADRESLNKDMICGSWRNNTPRESMCLKQYRGRGYDYSLSAKAV